MSIISTFFDIIVRMYFDDHAPPHIHVEYQGYEAQIAIADGSVVNGRLPERALALVRHGFSIIAPNWSRIGLTPWR